MIRARERAFMLTGGVVVLLVAGSHILRARGAGASDDMGADLARMRGVVASIPMLRDSLRDRRRVWSGVSGRLFAHHSVNGAMADASRYIATAARLSSVEVRSLDVVADSVRHGVVMITLSLTATADIRGVVGLLSRVERGDHLFGIRSIGIAQPSIAQPGSMAEALSVQLKAQTVGLIGNAP